MNIIRPLFATSVLLVACCSPAPEPAPTPPPVAAAPTPTPAPAPAPAPIAEPAYDNWMDAPASPGDWSYRDGTGLSFATYGVAGEGASFGVECAKRSRSIRLVRAGRAAGDIPVRIRTESADRMLTATPSADGRPMLIANVPASDRFLEAMAFSKGRFAVEASGLPTLYVPAWPEVTRVIEDCR